MWKACASCCVLLAACGRIGFEGTAPFPPAHLGDVILDPGSANLVIYTSIDTTSLTVDGSSGPAFEVYPQDSGPDVAVLTAGRVIVPAGADVQVSGSRALVIAATMIEIDGTLDAGAHGTAMGPGATTMGQSGTSVSLATNCDPGGAGGSHAQLGGAPGHTCDLPGATGAVYGDADVSSLVGGSPGGAGSPGACGAQPGGGGGGAIQLTAYGSITIAASGGVSAGGGGGAGGVECGLSDAGGGSGGGAGGALFLEALTLIIDGTVSAAGGGGGAGGNGQSQNGDISAGEPGGDGSADGPGPGGVSAARMNSCAGDGGAGGDAARPGDGQECSNGGGGGGGAGWVLVRDVD